MARSRAEKNTKSMYISDADKLLDRAFKGDQLAVWNLRASALFMSPQQAMGLLQRMGHPAQGDVLATPNAGQRWTSDRKVLVDDFQNRSREEPFQHLIGYLGELKKVPIDKQPKSDEFSELSKTINDLSKSDAQTFLSNYSFGPNPDLSADAFRQLKQGLQDRAGERVVSKGGDGELKDYGEFGIKGKHSDELPSTGPQVQDAYKNAMVSSPAVAYGQGRTLHGRGTYQNVSSLQVNKKNIAGKTVRDEFSYRFFHGTQSSIDLSKAANANQSFIVGAEFQANAIHANYTVKSEPMTLSLAGKEVETSFEATVDSYGGVNGCVSVSFSAGPHPSLIVGGQGFAGVRAVADGKLKINVAGHDLVELKGKVYASDGAEGAVLLSFGNVYDSIEGKVITTGFEAGGTAFVGVRRGYELGGDLAGVGGKFKVETLGGIGLIGKIYAKSEKGGISFGGEHGAALGVGGGWSWGVSVNPGKVAKAIHKHFPAKIEAAISAAPGAIGRKVAGGAKFVATTAATQAQTAGKALHSAGVDMRDRAINGGRTVGTFAANAWTAAGNQAQNFKPAAGKFSADLSRKIRSQQVSRPSPTTQVSRRIPQVGHGGVGPDL